MSEERDRIRRIKRLNEQAKAVSSVFINLGTALLIAGFVSWWSSGALGFWASLWLGGGGITIGVGVALLGRLELED